MLKQCKSDCSLFKVMDDFVDDVLASSNITIISQQVFVHDPITQVTNLKVSCCHWLLCLACNYHACLFYS